MLVGLPDAIHRIEQTILEGFHAEGYWVSRCWRSFDRYGPLQMKRSLLWWENGLSDSQNVVDLFQFWTQGIRDTTEQPCQAIQVDACRTIDALASIF